MKKRKSDCMQLTTSEFKRNLLNSIIEKGIDFDEPNIKFVITPVKEANVKYNSLDDYIRLGMLERANLEHRYFSLDEAVDFLAFPNQKFPLWIKVLLKSDLKGI